MKSILAIAIALYGAQALAGTRQHIDCEEVTKSKTKITLSAGFDPDKEQETVWSKDKNGHDVIITYKLGEINTKTTSSARVKLKLAPTPYAFDAYYNVNTKEGTGGYAYKFDGKPYRSIHGSSDQTDIMFYYPEEIVGKVAADFKALVTYQPPYLDQGYYNVDMICESRIR